MQLNTQSIKSRFEKSMDKYDENAVVQKESAEKLAAETAKIRKNFDVILETGSGTGLLTQEIKKHLIFKTYYANDLVEKSRTYVTKIIPQAKFIHGNAVKINVPQKPDLIISNAMFQWFNKLENITGRCKTVLNKDGILAFSTFGPENFIELKNLSGLTLNYRSKEEIIKTLEADFEVIHYEEYIRKLNFKTPPELLLPMKNTGVNSLSAKPWTIKEVKDFCEKYLEKFGRVQLTYNPVIVIAKVK